MKIHIGISSKDKDAVATLNFKAPFDGNFENGFTAERFYRKMDQLIEGLDKRQPTYSRITELDKESNQIISS